MRSFEFINKLWELFTTDDEMASLLSIYSSEDYELRVRRQDVMPEWYDPNNLPFIAMYFLETGFSYNHFVAPGYLCIETYAHTVDDAVPIVNRIMDILHKEFDLRLEGEGQFHSGIENVYKYRLVFKPLIFT